MDRSIVPPVLRAMGRNFSAGRITNLSFPKNLTITTPTTPSGARNFLNLSHAVGSGGRCQGGGGGGERDSSWSIGQMIRARCAPGQIQITQPLYGGASGVSDVAAPEDGRTPLKGYESPANWQAGKPALPIRRVAADQSHPLGGYGQSAAEDFAVGGVVELDGVVVVGEHAAMVGVRVNQTGIGGFGVGQDSGVNVCEVRGMDESQSRVVGGDEEHAAVAVGMNPDAGEDRLQGFAQGGGEEIAAWLEEAEGVTDKGAAGAEDATDGSERFFRQKMRGGGVAEKSIEDDGIVLLAAAIEEVASISDREMDLVRLKVEEAGAYRHDGGIDFDYVHAGALASEVHRHDAHTETDAEHVGDVGGVGPGQAGEHVSELGDALLARGIVGVLGEEIVEIITGLGETRIGR